MEEEKWVELLTNMQIVLNIIDSIKRQEPAVADGRALSIAATHLETAMLWVANARQEA